MSGLSKDKQDSFYSGLLSDSSITSVCKQNIPLSHSYFINWYGTLVPVLASEFSLRKINFDLCCIVRIIRLVRIQVLNLLDSSKHEPISKDKMYLKFDKQKC